MTYTLPPNNVVAGNSGHILTHNDLADIMNGAGLGWNLLNTAFAGGADPTMSTDSTAAINSIIANAYAATNYFNTGIDITSPPGRYLVSSPIPVTPYTGLGGSKATNITSGSADSGTVFVASSSFAQGSAPINAVFYVMDQTTGGYSTTSEEQHFHDFMIDGSSLSGSSNVAGIGWYAGSQQPGKTSLDNLNIFNTTGWGIYQPQGVGQVRGRNVHCRMNGTGNHANNAGGFLLQNSDSQWEYSGAYNTYGDGVQVTNSFDSVLNFHSEHSASGYGVNYKATYNNSAQDAGCCVFADCSVDGGVLDGLHVTSTGSNLPPFRWNGGFIRRPGTLGTGGPYGGIFVDAYFGPVDIDTQVYPGQPDGGGSVYPAYAVRIANCGGQSTVITLRGQYIGQTGHITTDGSPQSVTTAADVVLGIGSASSVQTYAPGVPLQMAASGAMLPVLPELAVAPANAAATTHNRRYLVTTSGFTGFTPASGTVYWSLIQLVAGVPITNISTLVQGTAKSGGTHGWVALANTATGKIVAVSADHTDAATTWGTTNTPQAIALASGPYIPATTGAYWVGLCIVATTMPLLVAGNAKFGQLAVTAPVLCGTSATGQTTPPSTGTSLTVTGNANDDLYAWCT